jgi:uncharacterized protein YdcH (DUF465 family)
MLDLRQVKLSLRSSLSTGALRLQSVAGHGVRGLSRRRLNAADHHERTRMFPEHRELISQLKTTDHHFKTLFDRHNALDQKIKNMQSHLQPGTHEEIETQKKEKLLLKDQLYVILQKAARAPGAPSAH